MTKRMLGVGGALAMLAGSVGCTVGVGVDPVGGAGGGVVCEPLSCQDAVSGGLDVQGDALCDAVSDGAYGDLLACACNGACPECDANLCTDSGMDGACAACVGATCGGVNAACGAN